ncbi:hypothetical protein O181_054832 [Austropuccinia psidii MF-1]|uniref:Uncharacterized protein n=1 Tax=Austropuccinia psidii MF-1 TaxID=1389203 RepID=A0A9Q3ECF4_9BASI|nr:hypothetical protein [Austropuccinia psidii MF-1]
MPSTRSGASYNPSSSSQIGYRHDYCRSQSVTEGQVSVNGSQTDKLCHSEADNTVLASNRADTTTRSLSGHIQSQPEGLQQCIAAQRVPNPCRCVENLHEFLPDCEKIPGPSQNLIEEKQPSITQESAKNRSSSKKQQFQHEKKTQSQNKGKGKEPATKPYIQGYRIPKIQQDSMENVFQMAGTMIEFQEKE